MKKLEERLSRSFVPAHYGYWIDPTGKIINIDNNEGHLANLYNRYEFIHIKHTESQHEWYEAALTNGWVRIIAKDHDISEYRFQFFFLSKITKRILIDLINDLQDYKAYLFEGRDDAFQSFRNKQDAVNFVTNYSGPISLNNW